MTIYDVKPNKGSPNQNKILYHFMSLVYIGEMIRFPILYF